MTTALQPSAVDPGIGAAIEVYERLNTIRNVLAPDLNDQELQLFALVAHRSRLDPFAKQIYAIKRKGRVTFQTGIDGFRSSAEETDEYRGSDEPTFGEIADKPFPHPASATVIVHRQFANGEWLHQPSTAYWDEMYPGDEQGFQWRKMPRTMLAKCAEASAFRKAFPKRFSDVYTAEEMDQADAVDAARPVAPSAAQRIADRRAQVEAQSTETCSIASPKGAPCLVKGPHTEHVNGNKRWPTPKQAQSAISPAESQEHGRAADPAKPVTGEEAAGVVTAPAADLVSAAHETFGEDIVEGSFTPVEAGENDPAVQAGMDLLKQ